MASRKLDIYLKGRGLDVSEIPRYELLVPHFYQIPNNLYRPSHFFPNNSLDFIYCNDVSATKFYKILLKEWFDLIKIGGYLVLSPCSGVEIKNLFGRAAEIVHRGRSVDGAVLVVRKMTFSKRVLGDIESWSLGIITGGSRPASVVSFVESVRRQRIPNYEIIVSGKWSNPLGKDTKILDQAEAAERGHITRMKNAICEVAKYENILIVHDRAVLSDNWFKGVKLYGNSFEVLSSPQIDEKGSRAGDWLTLGGPLGTIYNIGALEYDDWDENVYISGTATYIKKSVWEDVRWDEGLFWNEGEDIQLTFDLRKRGYLARFNPYAEIKVTSWRHGLFPLHQRSSYKLGPKKGLRLRRLLWFFLRITNRIPYMAAAREFFFRKFIERRPLKRFLVTH